MNADEAATQSAPSKGLFPRWWLRFGWWVGAGVMLVAGVTNVVESYVPPAGWDSLLVRVVGWVLLFLIAPMIATGLRGLAQREEESRRPPVIPPTGVRATMADGTVVPIECAYQGWEPTPQGVHVWKAVVRLPEPPEDVEVDALPPYTTVMGLAGPARGDR